MQPLRFDGFDIEFLRTLEHVCQPADSLSRIGVRNGCKK